MIVRKILLLILVVLFLSLSARAQYVDRILRPCFSGVVPYVQVVTTSTGDIAMTTCTGGSVTVNGSPIGGGGGAPGAPTTSIQFNSSGAFGGSSSLTWVPPSLRIGTTGGGGGNAQLILNSNTPSGSVTIRPLNSAFTAWTLTLPPDGGNSGEFLQTDGAGTAIWAPVSGTGITSINGLTGAAQSLAVNTTNGTFGFSSSGTTHTLRIADATDTNRGFVNTGLQTFEGLKLFDGASPNIVLINLAANTNQSMDFQNGGGSKWNLGNNENGTADEFYIKGGTNGATKFFIGLTGNISTNSVAEIGWPSSGGAKEARDTGLARSSAGVIEVNNGTRVSGGGTLASLTALNITGTAIAATSTLQTGVFTVATLPTCNGTAEGTHAGVNDALAPAFLVAVAGGGAVHTSVYCNGTTWVAN